MNMEVNTIKHIISFNHKELPWFTLGDEHEDRQPVGMPQQTNENQFCASWPEVLRSNINWHRYIKQIILRSQANPMPQLDTWDTKTNNLANFIANRIFKVPDVEYVFFSREENSIEIWTVINTLNRNSRKRIYDVEYDILELFKDLYFDFHVICRNDRDITELYPSKDKIILKRP